MAEVALSQALSYARDLKSAYESARAREKELGQANERLRNGYQQSLQYALDLKRTYGRLQRAIFQSLLGLANALEAKDPCTRGHSARVAELARQLALHLDLPRSTAETIAQAALLHVTQELGLDPQDKPSPQVAAVSSFFTFSLGALVPLVPFLLGFSSLALGLVVGGVGLLVAGGLAALATGVPWWLSATRQLAFGAIAAGATYLVGLAMGVGAAA